MVSDSLFIWSRPAGGIFYWVPAFAGMTVRVGNEVLELSGTKAWWHVGTETTHHFRHAALF